MAGSVTPVWLFDLDNTLHDAGAQIFGEVNRTMSAYVQRELGVTASEADHLRRQYFLRYGATLLGLVRHHGVRAAHFLHDTHRFPNLAQQVSGHPADLQVLQRLAGRKYVLTNAPRDYAVRVLRLLDIERLFDGVLSIEDMSMFGHLRPKPDARMFKRIAVRLGVHPSRCVLVEDTLVHQKAARSVGMRTVWMQRYLRRLHPNTGLPVHRAGRPAYVDLKLSGLRPLLSWRGAESVFTCTL